LKKKVRYLEKFSYLKLSIKPEMMDAVVNVFKAELSSGNVCDWSKEASIDSLLPLVEFVDEREETVLIGFDLFNLDLVPTYPSDDEVFEEMGLNTERNFDVKGQQEKDLKNIGINPPPDLPVFKFPEGFKETKVEMKEYRLVEGLEEVLEKLLKINGVDEGCFAFRNRQVEPGYEIYAAGSSEDGVYVCSPEDELSDPATW